MTGHRKILLVAYPGQGLINPSLRLANRLLKIGISVTFCTSSRVMQTINKQTTPHGLAFATFSDGHDDYIIGKPPPTTLQQHISDFATHGAPAVAKIITSATAKGEPFDHLVYTTIIPWAARVANSHNLKSTLFWCQPACVLLFYYHYFNGFQELISAYQNNPLLPIKLPGLPLLTMSDLPSFFLPSSPKQHEFLLPLYKDHVDVIKSKASPRILLNSFNELEVGSFKEVKGFDFLPIGPLNGKDSYGTTLEDDYVIVNWLNTKAKKSVVYVSFGSISHLTSDQCEEVVSGLLEGGRPFIWVIRNGEEVEKLRKIDELKKLGLIVSWCCQVEVLSHEAIGCFVMHCGWNSTVEAVAAGVPIVAYPQWTDQTTNGKMIEDVWKVGVRVRREGGGVVEGKEIDRCVKMVMGDEEISGNVLKWKELASEAVKNGGSSSLNLQAFLDDA
ncbi:hypothetical protein L1987_37603 [Smallanthus sonchifolius]|uniref:Uncharacterized protein n=1 Tax=Smallanthus sonchifolius TaxID=185202 RepID=A0ACB9HGT7_9ASTR|nr:hypothetical protein L1987_37603 [Smallanthus sonchifolius]